MSSRSELASFHEGKDIERFSKEPLFTPCFTP